MNPYDLISAQPKDIGFAAISQHNRREPFFFLLLWMVACWSKASLFLSRSILNPPNVG
jgi:hypothetical protein